MLTISPVRREQFADWLRLREAVYTAVDRTFHEREMESYFPATDKLCLLAVDEAGAVCGMLEASLRNVVDGCLSSPVGYIEGVYVDAQFRQCGAARQLVQAAEAWCLGQGCTELATDAELENEEAQRFHRRMGFEETFRIVEFRKALSPRTPP